MSQQDKLFALIKALTPGEKAYFTKYSRIYNAKDKPDYVRLFEFMDSLDVYDEAAITKHFKGEKFIKQLSRKKTQLRDKIMESLSFFHADRTVEVSLRRQMNVLPVLYEKAAKDKALIKEYETLIKKIKKEAEKQELFGILIDLFDWEKRLAFLQDIRSKTESRILERVSEQQKYYEEFRKTIELKHVYEQVALIVKRDMNISLATNRKKVRELLTATLEKWQSPPHPSKAKSYYHYLKSNCSKINGNKKQEYKHAKKMVQTLENQQTNLYEIASEYKKSLCHYLNILRGMQMHDEFPEIIEKMKLSYGNVSEDMRVFNTTRYQSLVCWLDSGKFNKAVEVSDDIKEHWDQLCKVIPRRRQLSYCYNIVIAYWFCGERIKDAMFWLCRLLNYESTKESERLIYNSRIIQLPISYDYEDMQLSNRVESTRRVLANQNRLLEFEQMVIDCFRKLVKSLNNEQSTQIISDFYQKLMVYKHKSSSIIPVCGAMEFWCILKGVGTVEEVSLDE